MNTLLTISRLADRGGRFGRGHGAPWIGLVVVLAVAALVAGLVMWLLRRRADVTASAASSTSAAQAIVAERLARGEIGPDEYHSLLATLRGEVLVSAVPADPATEVADSDTTAADTTAADTTAADITAADDTAATSSES